ncbi:hypothetical protein Fuma_02830 [Fuerstiella marisgermanici]|uniref:Uncharacterized protein n=1 Tax=Fuerstiella marisgermanici TaxID=1891926 RepID=A0A1P8WGP1_9PLAN|nr:hypothetical protein Fuma_02830 [Fuerstiella marisgermanici]
MRSKTGTGDAADSNHETVSSEKESPRNNSLKHPVVRTKEIELPFVTEVSGSYILHKSASLNCRDEICCTETLGGLRDIG